MKIQLSDHFTFGRLLRFTWPSIVMMVFTSIYSVVDGIFVSNFAGKTAFAAVNLIMPYAYPRFYSECGQEAVARFSRTCLENSRDILLALESSYRARYARNLTLSRLSEAVILPLSPDKGTSMRYDANLTASACLESDLLLLTRMQDAMG